MTPELANAIRQTQDNFGRRDRAEDWSRNIIESSKGLKTQKDWTLYYAFLSNPTHFDPTAEHTTITGDETFEAPLPQFEVVTHQNGPDFEIHYKRKPEITEDDEKTEN